MASDKKAQAWAFWLSTLSPSSAEALQQAPPGQLPAAEKPLRIDDEYVDAYAQFRELLSANAREQIDVLVEQEPEPEADAGTEIARFGMVEALDGEWAIMRTFKTAEGLARRMGQVEGEDMVVWPLYGLPLRFTKGPQRYLFLPGNDRAIQIPVCEGGPCQIIPADLLASLDIQDDGYIGPAALAETHPPPEPAEVAVAASEDDEEGADE